MIFRLVFERECVKLSMQGASGHMSHQKADHDFENNEDPSLLPWYQLDWGLGRKVLSLGLPVIVGMMTQGAINWIDQFMIGRLPKEEAITGLAVTGPALIMLWAFGGSLSAIQVGTQALTGRRFGEGSLPEAGKVLTNSLFIAVTTSALMTFAAVNAAPLIFESFPGSEAFRADGIAFCSIRFLGIFPMVATMAYKAFYDGLGRVWVHVSIALVMNVLNFVLDWVLIFGHLGAPQMGIEGAAWASVISSAMGLVMLFAYTLSLETRGEVRVYRLKNLNRSTMFSVGRQSFFAGIATLVVMSGFALFYLVVAKIDEGSAFPDANKATFSVVTSVAMLCFLTSMAFGAAPHTLVAQSMGAKNVALARRYGRESVKLIGLLMGVIGLSVWLFPETIFEMFLPAQSEATAHRNEVIRLGVESLRICGLWFPIAGAGLVLTQVLYGAGESKFVMMTELILHFTCLTPLAWLFAITFGFGLAGCWYASGVYAVLLFIATLLRFRGKNWESNAL